MLWSIPANSPSERASPQSVFYLLTTHSFDRHGIAVHPRPLRLLPFEGWERF
jgi:hypothetical protein